MGCTLFVTCILKRKQKLPSIMQVGFDMGESFEYASKLLGKIEEFEKKVPNIPLPEMEEQKYNNGYCSKNIFEDYYVTYKRIDDKFYIVAIGRKDTNGFWIHDELLPVPSDYKFIKK